MVQADKVMVYSFHVYDAETRSMALANFQAPRGLIVNQHRGHVLEGTGHEVAVTALDTEGRYRRLATGWGELN